MLSIDTTLAYLAGLFDGEGSIGVREVVGAKTPRKRVTCTVMMTDLSAVEHFSALFGGFTRPTNHHTQAKTYNRKPMFCWRVSGRNAERFLKMVYPFLRVKRSAASDALAYLVDHPVKHTVRSRAFLEVAA